MPFVFDTCVWIDVEQGRLGPADVEAITGDEDVFLSPVTLAELRYGAEMARQRGERQRRFAALRRLEAKPLLPIDAGTAAVFGSLAAALRSRGKQPRGRLHDLWLASQAIQHAFGLLTRNRQDFGDIPGLALHTYKLPHSH